MRDFLLKFAIRRLKDDEAEMNSENASASSCGLGMESEPA